MSVAVSETQAIQTAPQTESAALISMIARASADPNVSIDKMERLFAMHKEMAAEKRKTEYQAAMALAQAEIGPVVKDRKNEHTKSMYATLEAVDAAIRPIYTAHGFSLSFDAPDVTEKGLLISCDVLHSSGHSEHKTLLGALDTVGPSGTRNKTDIQGLGSTVSYLRRYLTCMVFNVTVKNEDKDGNKTAQTINAAQYVELTEKLELVKGDPEKFAELFRVQSLTEIPASRFDDAIRKIELKSQKLAEERAANAG